MTDRELIDALAAGQFKRPSSICPCGAPRSVAPPFHKRSTNHDCVHHPRFRCWTCKAADRMLAAIEARLVAEVEHGPFVL